MKIDKETLYILYMDWVYRKIEENEFRTHFKPKEIINAIAKIIEENPKLIKNESKIK